MLCTKQKSFHWPSTFARPRSVKRSSPCVAHVGEQRLDRRQAPPISRAPGRCVDPRLHLRLQARRKRRGLAAMEHHGADPRACRIGDALGPKRTRSTPALGPNELLPDVIANDAVVAVAHQGVTGGTDTRARIGVVGEIARGKDPRLYHGKPPLIMERLGLQLVRGLCREARIAFPQVIVSDERIDRPRLERAEIRFAVIAGVGRNQGLRMEERANGVHDRQQELVFGAGAVRLRVDDDLMPRVDRRHSSITLHYAAPGGHLRAVIVRAIALPHRPLGPAAVVGMRGEPRPQLRGVLLEARNSRVDRR